MTSIKLLAIVLAAGFATGIGCGSDSGGNPVDAPVISGMGGAVRQDAGAGGTGGATVPDAPISTGGTTSGIDGSVGIDAPQATEAGNQSFDSSVGEAASAVTICTGLTAAACDLTIRNAAVDPSVTAQDVSNTNPPAYQTCSQ